MLCWKMICEKALYGVEFIKWGLCVAGLFILLMNYFCYLLLVCRSLGIPTRSVTNFDSGHDVDMSMTIDRHISSVDGEPVNIRDDSVW